MATDPEYSKQTSTGSEFVNDPVLFLPYEVVADIFQYVPTLHIIHVCRLVSKTWKTFIDHPQFWQYALRKSNSFHPKLIEIPTMEIHWPRLYLNTAWGPNLVKNFDSGKLSLKPWTISYSSWLQFSEKMTEKSQETPARHEVQIGSPSHSDESDSEYIYDSHEAMWGGGDKWTIESSCITPEDPNYECLVKENGGSTVNYVTSYEWCCREQIIKLSDHGFSDAVMDSIQPSITVSEWFAARWDCGSIFSIRVDLLSSEKKVIAKYADTVTTDQWLGGELGWRRVEHVFRGYDEGVRFVRFADGGKDTKWWAGHYGSKMAGARVGINLKQ